MVVGVSDRGFWDYWVGSAPALGSSIGLVGLDAAVVGRPDAIVPYWMMPVARATRLGCPGLGVVGFVGPYVGSYLHSFLRSFVLTFVRFYVCSFLR